MGVFYVPCAVCAIVPHDHVKTTGISRGGELRTEDSEDLESGVRTRLHAVAAAEGSLALCIVVRRVQVQQGLRLRTEYSS